LGLDGACSQRLPSHNNNESRLHRCEHRACRSREKMRAESRVAMAPRRTAQHTVFILRIVPILAPLPPMVCEPARSDCCASRTSISKRCAS
jgi:hypothetical protein